MTKSTDYAVSVNGKLINPVLELEVDVARPRLKCAKKKLSDLTYMDIVIVYKPNRY